MDERQALHHEAFMAPVSQEFVLCAKFVYSCARLVPLSRPTGAISLTLKQAMSRA